MIFDKENSKEIFNPDYTLWHKTDQIPPFYSSRSRGLEPLTEPVLAQVVGLKTSREVWLSLEKSFSQQSTGSSSFTTSNHEKGKD